MEGAAESLMKVIARGLREPADHLWFSGALAGFFNLNEDPWLREAAMKFVIRHSKPGERLWYQFVFLVMLQSATHDPSKATHTASDSQSSSSSARVSANWPLLTCDNELREEVIALHVRMHSYGSLGSFEEYRRTIRSQITRGDLGNDRGLLELKALDFLESNLDGIEKELELQNIISDFSIRVAVHVFDLWVSYKLNAAGLSYRLVLDRLTSTYRLVPPEACGRLDDPNHLELRDIEPRTVLSACLIAYIMLPGIDGRIEEWVEELGLIDRLAFAGVLECFLRCQVCGRWVYAVNSSRNYCGDKCRYSVWMKTPKGLEKRRKASSAWRSRYSEEIRKATPNVKRRKITD
ncbi:MAG: hypothetical protein ABSA59_03660 [Terriglobia bacterium]|jgi:hypothetical protein